MFSEKYSAVAQLGKHSDVLLIRENDTGNLFIRRKVKTSQLETYKLLQKLQNPHIPSILNIKSDETGNYDVFEQYIDGQTLEEILSNGNTLKKSCAINYILQLIDALDIIHESGIIHRDIKPSNIIITPQNKLYLIDFDIARLYKEEKIHDTEFLGTQGYAPPEQFGFHQTEVSSDIYSIGVLLNVMLTGKFPIEGLYPGGIGRIIHRCTEMNYIQRYKNVKALRRVLQPYNNKTDSKAVEVIRQLPGFRSLELSKIILGLIFYAYFIFYMIDFHFISNQVTIVSFVKDIIAIIYYVYSFLFLFDSFGLRSRVRWLEESRGYFIYPLKCFFWLNLSLSVEMLISAIAGSVIEFLFF